MKHDIVEVEPGIYSILIGERSYEVRIEGELANLRGAIFPIAEEIATTSRNGSGSARITSPMPGKVIRLLVSEGDTVEAGQGIIVVEAMKMQNEMKAPRGGVVKSLKVTPGATVTAGELLALIE